MLTKNTLMSDSIRISIVQPPLVWENISENLAYFEQQLRGLKGQTDLIVLPEMFTTGFSMNTTLAESIPGPTFEWMSQLAQSFGSAITGSIICKENGQFYNRLLFVRPDGSYDYYDKKYLFSLGGEHKAYKAGNERMTLSYLGWKIRPLICYDLRFPVWSRNTDGYDLLIYVANWPDKRRHHWMSLLAARAIENQSYCVGVNRVGTDSKGHYYSGDSSVYDYSGRLLVQLTDQASIVTISISKEKQSTFRQKLDFLSDQDAFQIK